MSHLKNRRRIFYFKHKARMGRLTLKLNIIRQGTFSRKAMAGSIFSSRFHDKNVICLTSDSICDLF